METIDSDTLTFLRTCLQSSWHAPALAEFASLPSSRSRVHFVAAHAFPSAKHMRQCYRIRRGVLLPASYIYRWYMGLRSVALTAWIYLRQRLQPSRNHPLSTASRRGLWPQQQHTRLRTSLHSRIPDSVRALWVVKLLLPDQRCLCIPDGVTWVPAPPVVVNASQAVPLAGA
jgi:hypothetical protein